MIDFKMLDAAEAAIEAAERAYRDVIHATIHVGSKIRWQRGRGVQYGEVLHMTEWGRGDRMVVRNARTGKSYKITVYDVRQAR